MVKLGKSIVIATGKASALELTALAAQLSGDVTVIAVGDRSAAVNAARAVYIDTGAVSAIAAAQYIVKAVGESGAELVLAESTQNGRYFAAAAAAELRTSAVTDAMAVWLEDGGICAKRMVYGGAAVKTVRVNGTAVVCPSAGVAAAEEGIPCTCVSDAAVSMPEGVEYVSAEKKTVQRVNLAAAKRVVGVGRGVKNAENLAAAERFAAKIGAEMGCTRPVAEEDGLMPRERYLGVSGCTVKPDIYIAAGVSGQTQHMVGVNESRMIVAINSDKNAAIFDQCDFGIVGDMTEVLAGLGDRL